MVQRPRDSRSRRDIVKSPVHSHCPDEKDISHPDIAMFPARFPSSQMKRRTPLPHLFVARSTVDAEHMNPFRPPRSNAEEAEHAEQTVRSQVFKSPSPLPRAFTFRPAATSSYVPSWRSTNTLQPDFNILGLAVAPGAQDQGSGQVTLVENREERERTRAATLQ